MYDLPDLDRFVEVRPGLRIIVQAQRAGCGVPDIDMMAEREELEAQHRGQLDHRRGQVVDAADRLHQPHDLFHGGQTHRAPVRPRAASPAATDLAIVLSLLMADATFSGSHRPQLDDAFETPRWSGVKNIIALYSMG